jgi:uncharacterized membrane protein
VIAAALGLAIALSARAAWSVDVLAAWYGAATAYLGLVWPAVWRKSPADTASLAQREDDSPQASEVVLLSASVASLVAVAFTLVEAGDTEGWARAGLSAFALGSVALAWACVHTVFALRYARLYYSPPVGGIGFPGDEPPDYRDLGYLAFTIGMAFQVSDTAISHRGIRRVVTHHALLSYLFGAVILAVAINSVAGLLEQ